MTELERTQMNWGEEILHSLKNSKVVASIVVALILGIGAFAWKNIDPPLVKAQIEEIKTVVTNHIESEEQKDVHRDIDAEVTKTNVSNMKTKVDDISTKIDRLNDLVIESITLSRQIKENTK